MLLLTYVFGSPSSVHPPLIDVVWNIIIFHNDYKSLDLINVLNIPSQFISINLSLLLPHCGFIITLLIYMRFNLSAVSWLHSGISMSYIHSIHLYRWANAQLHQRRRHIQCSLEGFLHPFPDKNVNWRHLRNSNFSLHEPMLTFSRYEVMYLTFCFSTDKVSVMDVINNNTRLLCLVANDILRTGAHAAHTH